MKRLVLYLGLALVALVILAGAGLAWLLGTREGAVFALTKLPETVGIRVSAQSVEGRLWDRLKLSGLRIVRPKLAVQIDRLDLSWQPRRLRDLHLAVSQLALKGVRVQDDAPPSAKTPTLGWPRVSGLTRRLTARVERLAVDGLSYRHLSAPPVLLNQLSGSLDYRDGTLTLSRLSADLLQGKGSGELVAGFSRPSLRLDLVLVPARAVNGLDLFSLQARLTEGKSPEFLAGSIAVAGRSGGAQRLELTGELAVTRDSFLVRRLNLARPGTRGSLTGSGRLTLTKKEPLLTLALKGSDLDLRDQLHQPTRLSGSLNFSGTASSYTGNLDLQNRGTGWQSASLAARYRGGLTRITLDQLNGLVLDGRLSGRLDVDWSKELQLRGTLAGRALNPGRLAADWSGRVNLDLTADVTLPKGGTPRGKLDGRLLESRLHGQELQGELVAAFAGERLTVDRLLLKGKGFDLRGSGRLDRRFDLTARVQDLSRLVPGAAGSLDASAWLRWRDHRLAGSATGQGAGLAMNGIRAARARLDARLGEGAGYPVHLDAALTGLAVSGFRADSARLTLDGSAARHTLGADLCSPEGAAQLFMAGGYANGVWRGELGRFSGHDRVGPWELVAPAALQVSAGRLYLAPLVLRGVPGEHVEMAADLATKPLGGDLRGSWSGLNLARANSWLVGTQLTGASAGEFSLRLLPGRRVLLAARAEARGTVSTDGRSIGIERVSATVDGDARGLRAALDLALSGGSGSAQILFDSRSPASLALPNQGDLTVRCSELDLALLRPYLPAGLQVEGRLAGLVTGKLLPGQKLDAKGNVALTQGKASWQQSETEGFDALLQKAELNFAWRRGKGENGRLRVAGEVAATGEYRTRGERIALERFGLRIDADDSGLRAGLDLALAGGATLRGNLFSPAPTGLALPATGEFALEWGGINPVLLKPWLPGALNLQGVLAGQVRGKLLPGGRLDVEGATDFSQGQAGWQGTGGELKANLRSAALAFTWRGETLDGTLTLSLAEYGSAQGRLQLPLPARLPIAANPAGALKGSLNGPVREQGLLTSIFPGLVQESHGDLELALALAGTWQDPSLTGSATLAKAGAYLPSAGVRVSDLQFAARLEKDQVKVENLRATSGAGHLEGEALVRLKGWQVTEYRATLNGERFQTVYLPELQLLTSPHLSVQGDTERVAIRGEVRIPEMLISGPPTRSVVTPSRDVILEGAPAAHARSFPLEVDGQIRLVLGDKVLVKAEGIDAKLGGEMDLALKGLDSITSNGEIRVVKGRYKAYGIDLEIVRGRLYYVGDPVEHPTLDILALRTVGDVKAGVTVAGPLGSQVVKLYSEPAMADVDIMAYMVLGHPLGSGSGDQASLVASAASSLLSFGQSESLQDQIKDRLGLNVLGLETVNQSTAGRMGYKEIPVTPTGVAPKTATTGESLLTVGKYLTPRLYLSYGRSLVTGGNLFQLRYDIFRHWQIETQSGSESGADLFYKLEFN